MIELKTRTIRGTDNGPHLLITAGVHGDEFEGVVAVHRLMRLLSESPIRGQATLHGQATLRGQVTLVPVVNESAYNDNRRCGADGLDLARTFPGTPASSVTHQVAQVLTRLIQSADLYIDLHSGGVAMEVYPLAGYMLVSEQRVLDAQRRMARAFGLPLVWGTSDRLEGRSLSVARDAQVPAIYVEYLGSGHCRQAGVNSMVDGCLNVMTEFGFIKQSGEPQSGELQSGELQSGELQSGDSPASRLVHEDPRPGSGHMQVGNIAPSAGLFEASVRLGQRVRAGETIGVVSDSFSGERRTIRAAESGLVITLRSYPRVDRDDSLAVILESRGELPPYPSTLPIDVMHGYHRQ